MESVEPGATAESLHESGRTTLTDVQVRTADGDPVATMIARDTSASRPAHR